MQIKWKQWFRLKNLHFTISVARCLGLIMAEKLRQIEVQKPHNLLEESWSCSSRLKLENLLRNILSILVTLDARLSFLYMSRYFYRHVTLLQASHPNVNFLVWWMKRLKLDVYCLVSRNHSRWHQWTRCIWDLWRENDQKFDDDDVASNAKISFLCKLSFDNLKNFRVWKSFLV